MWGQHVRSTIAVTLVVGSAALMACGGTTAPAATTSAPVAVGGSTITVQLAEWTVKPSTATAKTGSVSFAVTNKGTTPHELAIIRTDAAADALTQVAGVVDEKALPVVGRTAPLDAGKSETRAFDLKPGKYVLLCNLPAHFGQGMRAAFTVQ